MADDYTPRYVGDLGQPLIHTFVDASGAAFPLTGVNLANITIKFKNVSSGIIKTGLGTWSASAGDILAGRATYAWNAADVADPGLWFMQVSVPFPAGTQHFTIEEIEWISPL